MSDLQTFRIEPYYKTYNSLVKIGLDSSRKNTGNGYARGIDVFWRDKKTFKNVDYWISYSYLDTKRNYQNFPILASPTFASPHTFSIVYKQSFTLDKLNFSAGATYVFATGRPYYNPNYIAENKTFNSDKTIDYNNLSVNFSYITMFKEHFVLLAASVGNVLGINNVFSYKYSNDGTRRAAVGPAASRTFFIGLFISIGQDKGDI